jgi:hypothetical protein
MKTTRHAKARIVRKALGHGIGSRRVTVHNDGTVTTIGSTDDTDRSQDFRAYAGHLEELWRDQAIRAFQGLVFVAWVKSIV